MCCQNTNCGYDGEDHFFVCLEEERTRSASLEALPRRTPELIPVLPPTIPCCIIELDILPPSRKSEPTILAGTPL